MNDKKHSCLYASFLFWLLISICASALLIWCARKAYGSINPKQILFLEALVVLAFFLHVKRLFSLADTLGFTNSNPSYDIRYEDRKSVV